MASNPFRPATVADDPLPWLTPRFTNTGCFDRTPSGALTGPAQDALIGALSSIISGLSDDDRVYSVAFASIPTAGTNTRTKSVIVGTKVLDDPSLTDGQRATILLGECYHEVGHIRYSRDYLRPVETAFGAGNATAAKLSNIAEDVRIELLLGRDLPGYAPSLVTTLWWVGYRGRRMSSPPDFTSTGAMVSEATGIIRYPWLRDWAAMDAPVRAWAEWWVQWGKRAAIAHSPVKHVDVVREALDFLAQGSPVPTPPAPEPEPTPEADSSTPTPQMPETPTEDDDDAEDDTDPQDAPEAPEDAPDAEDDDEGEGAKDDGDDDTEDDTEDDSMPRLGDTEDGTNDDSETDDDESDDDDEDEDRGDSDDANDDDWDDDDDDEDDNGEGNQPDPDVDRTNEGWNERHEGEDEPEPETVDSVDEYEGGLPAGCPLTYTAGENDIQYQYGVDARTKARKNARGEREYTYGGLVWRVVRGIPGALKSDSLED